MINMFLILISIDSIDYKLIYTLVNTKLLTSR